MIRRPWPIVIMAFIHALIIPIFYHLLSSYMFSLSIYEYHQQLAETGAYYAVISRFILLPVAGAAIYITKRWSYYVFISIMIIVVLCNIIEHNAHPTNASFAIFLIITCINIACVSYFFVPSVSRVYYDKNVRWWEQKQRYKVNTQATIKTDNNETTDCTIENISLTGARLDTNQKKLNSSETMVLQFKDEDFEFNINFDVVHTYQEKLGVRFFHDSGSKSSMKKYIKYLIKSGAEPRTNIPPWYESLLEWLKNLITKGEGLTPDK